MSPDTEEEVGKRSGFSASVGKCKKLQLSAHRPWPFWPVILPVTIAAPASSLIAGKSREGIKKLRAAEATRSVV